MSIGNTDLWLLSPEIALTALALLVVTLDFFVKRKAIISIVSIAGLAFPAACATWIATQDNRQITGFYGMLRVDNYALFFDFLFILIGAGTILASYDYVRLYLQKNAGEFYALILFALVGAMLMASTGELITIYIALELTSFPLYVMAGMLRNNVPGDAGSASRSSEASIKYVLLGAMSSAILLYGMALLYGTTGSTDLGEIARALTTIGKGPDSLVLLVAEVFIFAGFGFKISAVPFHMWAPDIYQGAPTPGTLFFSVASKTAGFAALIRVFVDGGLFQASSFYLWGLIGVAAVLSMTLGNVVAIAQTDIKRMMAYSSIAQAGYILVGFTALAFNPSSASESTNSAMLIFLAVYVITNIGAFAGIIALANATGGERVRDFDGLVRRSPALAVGMSLCLLSLAGIPPFAGAISKIFIFIAAWQGGGFLPFIVIIALLNSVVSLVYYAGVVYRIFVAPPPREDRLRVSPALTAALTISVIGILGATIFFGALLQAGKMGAMDLFGFLTLASK